MSQINSYFKFWRKQHAYYFPLNHWISMLLGLLKGLKKCIAPVSLWYEKLKQPNSPCRHRFFFFLLLPPVFVLNNVYILDCIFWPQSFNVLPEAQLNTERLEMALRRLLAASPPFT